ncbi:MAG: hypothetical protein ACYC9O_18305, partial [Candidatus Latescibacterota bacterium]
ADLRAFEDTGDYLYLAGDCTRSYSPKKMDRFTRQIVFLRPGTFVIFDRVKSKDPAFAKTWLLQSMKTPEDIKSSPDGSRLMRVTNGAGRLFVQTVLPRNPGVKLVSGAELYRFDGKDYLPSRSTGPAPECRIEVSPGKSARDDYFLHVLTATDSTVDAVPNANIKEAGQEVTVTIGGAAMTFRKDRVGGNVVLGGKKRALAEKIMR